MIGEDRKQTKVFIAPGAVDSNKGDQALVTTAISLARKLFPNSQVGVNTSSTASESGGQGELRHTRKLGVVELPSILPSPRRACLRRRGPTDSLFSRSAMTLIALSDLVRSLCVLLFAKHKSLAFLFMNADQRKSFAFLSDSTCFLVKGGGFIYAYKGFRYIYYLYFQLFLFMLAQRLGVPVIVLPNSFGPFEMPGTGWVTQWVMNKCLMVATREEISYQLLQKLGVRSERLRFLPDMGFLTKQIEPEAAIALLKQSGVTFNRPLVGLTARPWRFPASDSPKANWDNYVNAIVDLANHIWDAGYMPVFFPQSIGPHDHEDDRIAINQICQKLSANTYAFVNGDFMPEELRGMYSQMTAFIGTRMHSIIFTLTCKVPALAISYQGPKASGIMHDFGLGDYLLDISDVSGQKLIESFNLLITNSDSIKKRIEAHLTEVMAKLSDWEAELATAVQKLTDRSR